MIKEKLLIVDDIINIVNDIKRKLEIEFPEYEIIGVTDCDHALYVLEQQDIAILLLDITFNNRKLTTIGDGKQLLKILQNKKIEVPTIIFSTHDSLEILYPIIANYKPKGYVQKNEDSDQDLVYTIKKVAKGYVEYGQKLNQALLNRTQLEFSLDAQDLLIIEHLAKAKNYVELADKKLNMDRKTISRKLERLRFVFDVDTDKQLLLKLQHLGFSISY